MSSIERMPLPPPPPPPENRPQPAPYVPVVSKPAEPIDRDRLAKALLLKTSAERVETLDQAKRNSDYWRSRQESVQKRQEEEVINNGEGVFLKKKTLYHGSNVAGIKEMNEAEEVTVGTGVYLTSTAPEAVGYARRRARREKESRPVIYETSVENVKMFDLRQEANVDKITKIMEKHLLVGLKDPRALYAVKGNYLQALEHLQAGKVNTGSIQYIARGPMSKLFTQSVEELGYEGIITFEGGEGDEVKDHDTYLIFDPAKVHIVQEHTID